MGKFKKQNKGLSPFVVVKVKNALLSIDYIFFKQEVHAKIVWNTYKYYIF